jgi:hypothetical protein
MAKNAFSFASRVEEERRKSSVGGLSKNAFKNNPVFDQKEQQQTIQKNSSYDKLLVANSSSNSNVFASKGGK